MTQNQWFRSLRKEDLTTVMTELGVETNGTVDEMKRRLRVFLSDEDNLTTHSATIVELQTRFAPSTSNRSKRKEKSKETQNGQGHLTLSETDSEDEGMKTPTNEMPGDLSLQPRRQSSGFTPVESTIASQIENRGKIMDQVRKWSVKYDGKSSSPLSFIERVEELAETYSLPLDVLPKAMTEMLISRALDWLRNNNKKWVTWNAFRDDFLKFFLPARHFKRLEDNIRNRSQQIRETCKDYVLALQDLMRQANYDDSKQLERIYDNSLPEYQLHIKRSEFNTLEEFLVLAEDYERIKRLNQPRNVRDGVARLELDPVDFRRACRKCAQVGHFSRYCRNARV